jgi:hypothetical protein
MKKTANEMLPARVGASRPWKTRTTEMSEAREITKLRTVERPIHRADPPRTAPGSMAGRSDESAGISVVKQSSITARDH